MSVFTIKVPNDEGDDLGQYVSDYLPRVSDPFVLWHPRVCPKKDQPFCGVVSGVTHEVFNKDHPYAPLVESGGRENEVTTVVWLVEDFAAPELLCVCSEEERAKYVLHADRCDGCGHRRA
jgi:hypothetical protein